MLITANISAKIWTVSLDGEYKFCSQINNLVSDGDTVEIEDGFYDNDKQVTWYANNLLIRGVKGRPVLNAGTIIENDQSNGKGIFVIRGNNTTVENIDFRNCKVQSWNGAGIRQEGSNLIVRNCVFRGNEMGILQGGTIANCKILVEFCEFLNNGNSEEPGYQHNIYINHIDTLIFRYNFSHDAVGQGHEFKSRANNTYILYNRISNINSVDSRNIDIPNGGSALIMGNIIEQGENSSNSNIIGFGLERLVNPGPHNIWIVNNTIVNRMNRGSFIQVYDDSTKIDTLFMKNNICVGAKTGGFIIGSPSVLDSSNNLISDDMNYPKFIDLENSDFHLTESSPAIDAGLDINLSVMGYLLKPEYEYKPMTNYEHRLTNGTIDIGAYEFVPEVSISGEFIENEEVLVYPNPATDFVTIRIKGEIPVQIKIIDILGNTIFDKSNLSHYNTIELKELPNNLYSINIYYKSKTIMNKFMILR
jgi:hypothetical protein